MDIHAYITQIAATFDRSAGMGAPAQKLLRRAPYELTEYAPTGFKVVGSGGIGVPAVIPWFGFLNPDETSDPREGLYVVYLFAASMERVHLTLIQGISKLYDQLGGRASRARLAADGQRIRTALGPNSLAGFQSSLDLGAGGKLPSGYEAGAVASVAYDLASLPTELVLRVDLERMLALYDDAIAAKQHLLLTAPGSISTASNSMARRDRFDHFKPKDSADYTAHITGGTFVRTRRHEKLIEAYGDWAQSRGFSPTTARHPIDLVLPFADRDWIFEGEVVRHGNAAHAVREAIGQLLEYRQFLYLDAGIVSPELVGLFTEPIGDAYVGLLESLGIASVWWVPGGWTGTSAALAVGVALPTT